MKEKETKIFKNNEVQSQSFNQTEQTKLTLDEREERIRQKVTIRAICRQCLTEIPSLTNRGLALSASEKILAEHQCTLDTNKDDKDTIIKQTENNKLDQIIGQAVDEGANRLIEVSNKALAVKDTIIK